MKSYIYSIKNTRNGKFYIGSTNWLIQRKSYHFCSLKKGTHHSSHLQNAYNQCGKESFEFSVIEECDSSIRKDRELHYILIYRAAEKDFGYNTHEPDENAFKCSDETRDKIRSTKKNLIPIDAYLIDGTKIGSYPSMTNCAKLLNINSGTVYEILKGRRKSINGYTFLYKDIPFNYQASTMQRFKKPDHILNLID